MAIHQIRLAGPWELLSGTILPEVMDVPGTADQVAGDRGARTRCQLPFATSVLSTSEQNFPAGVKLCRGFHQPAGLSETTEVSLIFVVNYTPIRTFLNDGILEPTEMAVELSVSPNQVTSDSDSTSSELWYCVRAKVTPLLRPFNRLIVELDVDVADRPPRKLHSVTLQIHELQPGRSSLTGQ